MKGVIRPKMTTMPASAQVPPKNLRRPPAKFTHRITARQPYFYDADASGDPPGNFSVGTRVARIADAGTMCQVVDNRGLSVFTSCNGLEPLTPRAGKRKR